MLVHKEVGTSGNSAVPSTYPTWDLLYMNWRMQNCKTVISARGLGDGVAEEDIQNEEVEGF